MNYYLLIALDDAENVCKISLSQKELHTRGRPALFPHTRRAFHFLFVIT